MCVSWVLPPVISSTDHSVLLVYFRIVLHSKFVLKFNGSIRQMPNLDFQSFRLPSQDLLRIFFYVYSLTEMDMALNLDLAERKRTI